MQRYRRGHNGMDSKSIVRFVRPWVQIPPAAPASSSRTPYRSWRLFYRWIKQTTCYETVHCTVSPKFINEFGATCLLCFAQFTRSFRRSSSQNLSYSGASDFVNRVYELSIFVATFFFIEKCIVAGEFCSPVTMHLQTINFLQIVGVLDRFFKFAVIVHISRNAGIHSLRVACDNFRI